MKNLFRGFLGAAYLALGLYSLIQGNPGWLVALGFTNWVLPTIFTILGAALSALSFMAAMPRNDDKSMRPA